MSADCAHDAQKSNCGESQKPAKSQREPRAKSTLFDFSCFIKHCLIPANYPLLMPLPARDAQLVQIREARLLQSIDASLADAARRAGDFLACRIGCTQCCYGAFAINALDAARLRLGMAALRDEDPALATAIEIRVRAWLAEHGAEFPGDRETGALGTSAVPTSPALKTSPTTPPAPRSTPRPAVATSTSGAR
jgi:hypothetical protein